MHDNVRLLVCITMQQYRPICTRNKLTSRPVAVRDFFKTVSQIPRQEGGVVKMLAIEYIHRISSSMTHNQDSKHGTRVQQRLCN
jgi:hypothetical protein